MPRGCTSGWSRGRPAAPACPRYPGTAAPESTTQNLQPTEARFLNSEDLSRIKSSLPSPSAARAGEELL